jgi:transposase
MNWQAADSFDGRYFGMTPATAVIGRVLPVWTWEDLSCVPGVEASLLGIWLYRELQPAGVPIIVVEARHMRVSLSTMRNKTDRNDARGIAQMMRLGWYRAVHVKNIDMQKMRSLLANRKLLKRKRIDIENHIRGTLRSMAC